jgi:hypothetical protein
MRFFGLYRSLLDGLVARNPFRRDHDFIFWVGFGLSAMVLTVVEALAWAERIVPVRPGPSPVGSFSRCFFLKPNVYAILLGSFFQKNMLF